ncbi:zc3h12a-like ribonuclease NYN domain-containing protein [Ditylenchus destructor]|nr:zc3h12a-like ribonuclease NYN domain-containing protein [Ditylenchus destructor]
MDNLIEFSSGPSSDEDGVLAKHTEMPIKRMAIIDTCNILHECAGCASNLTNPDPSERPKPDALGILALAKVFLEEGYDIKMFVPVSYMNPNKVVNVFILEQFHHLGYLTIIDDGSHDDLLILEMAKNVGGFVVSNDKFRDHLAKVESLMNVIKARTVFCRAKRIPIYDVGKEFIRTAGNKCYIGFRLNFTPNKKAMYAENDDPSFAMAFAQRKNRLQSKVRHALEVIGVMYDYFQHMNCLANNVRPPILEYFDPAQEEFPQDDFAIFLDRYYCHQDHLLSLSP